MRVFAHRDALTHTHTHTGLITAPPHLKRVMEMTAVFDRNGVQGAYHVSFVGVF